MYACNLQIVQLCMTTCVWNEDNTDEKVMNEMVVLVMFMMIILMITPMIEAIKGVSLSKRLKQLRVIKMTYKNVNIVTK